MYELVSNDHPILQTSLEDFDFSNPPIDPLELIQNMAKVMYDKNGLGLAANQLGLPYRVFIIRSSPNIACFNPKIVDFSDEVLYMEEGCLSFPGLIINIKRPRKIRIRYTQPNGEIVTHIWEGMTARIAQHEIDHLNGIVFTKKATKYHLERAKNKKQLRQRMKIKNGTKQNVSSMDETLA